MRLFEKEKKPFEKKHKKKGQPKKRKESVLTAIKKDISPESAGRLKLIPRNPKNRRKTEEGGRKRNLSSGKE
jgi:hypothetical protein